MYVPKFAQETRAKLFNDYLETGQDFSQVEALFQSRLEETQQTKVKYGFRSQQWLIQNHGNKKATKIIERKTKLGLNLGVIILKGWFFTPPSFLALSFSRNSAIDMPSSCQGLWKIQSFQARTSTYTSSSLSSMSRTSRS